LAQDSLETYLRSRMSGVGNQRAKLLVDEFGEDILQVLRKPAAAALEALGTVPGLSSRVATEIKDSWDFNKYRSEPSYDLCDFPSTWSGTLTFLTSSTTTLTQMYQYFEDCHHHNALGSVFNKVIAWSIGNAGCHWIHLELT